MVKHYLTGPCASLVHCLIKLQQISRQINFKSRLSISFGSLYVFFWFYVSFDPKAPNIFSGTFSVPENVASDTFLLPANTTNNYWYKGVAYVNNYNLGRYWPVAGPQVTLYTPGPWLNPSASNSLTMVELLSAPCGDQPTCSIELIDYPILNKKTQLDSPSMFRRRPRYH